jgi:hypothetical protein
MGFEDEVKQFSIWPLARHPFFDVALISCILTRCSRWCVIDRRVGNDAGIYHADCWTCVDCRRAGWGRYRG